MKNSIPEGIKKLQAELERKEKYWRDWNGRAANRAAELEQRIAQLEAEIERLRPDTERYEELRSLIDDGHEAMTHDDAVKELAGMREESERLRKELASYRKGDCRRKIDKAMEGD